MGSCCAREKPPRILMLGLDGAGKTTILYRLKNGRVDQTVPTIGFNVETITHSGQEFSIWDVGGQDSIRGLWRHYYAQSQGVIFVIDSNDSNRFLEAKEEIERLLNELELKSCPFVVYANKQDLPNAVNGESLANTLQINNHKNRKIQVFECSATGNDDDGLSKGLNWLQQKLKESNKK